MEKIIYRLSASWLLAALLQLAITGASFTSLDFSRSASLPVLLLLAALFFLLLSLVRFVLPNQDTDRSVLLTAIVGYGCTLLLLHQEFYFLLGLTLACVLAVCYLAKRPFPLSLQLTFNQVKWALALLAGYCAILIGIVTVCRYLSHVTSTYDFGIFAQMFYSMKTRLTPVTTCERDMALSHFAIHLSPAYYLLLPFYWIAPSPITLQVLQAALLASGILPLYKLCRLKGCSPAVTLCLGAAYCLSPALMGGCFYDIHENFMLAPLLLWLLWALSAQKRPWLVGLIALATLLVKEDAAVYVACVGLYWLLDKRQVKRGAALLAGSVAYFAFALLILKAQGHGVMTNRYDNFISNDSLGLLSVFHTLLVDPAYLISQVFTQEKLIFTLSMLVPLAFAPAMLRRPGQLALWIPFVLVNLMSNYPYQHSIYFQYVFGSMALLLYLAMENLPGLPCRWRRTVALSMALASLFFHLGLVFQRSGILNSYLANRELHHQIDTALAQIPSSASVTATTYLLPQVSQRDEVYMYPSTHDSEYLVIDTRPGRITEINGQSTTAQALIAQHQQQGYEIFAQVQDGVCILHKEQ